MKEKRTKADPLINVPPAVLDKLTGRKTIFTFIGEFPKDKKLEEGIKELKKNLIFTNNEFFINKEKRKFFVDLEGKPFTDFEKKELKKLGYVRYLYVAKPEKPKPGQLTFEEIEDSFKRLSQREYFLTSSQLVKDLPKFIPYRLDNKQLIEKTETSKEIIAKYQKSFGNEIVTCIFIIPKEKYKEDRTPRFGEKAKKVLLTTVNFAIEEKTLDPKFRKYHILRLISKDKIFDKDYKRLDNIFQTLACATYDIENKKKGKEYRRSIGHIVDNVDWIGKGKNSYISVNLNKRYFNKLIPLIEGKEQGYQYLSILKNRLTETLSEDESNFLNWIDSLGGRREVYPMMIKTIFIEKLGYTDKKLRKIGTGGIATKLNDCLEKTKELGRLREPYYKYVYGKEKSFKTILQWKLKLYLKRNQ